MRIVVCVLLFLWLVSPSFSEEYPIVYSPLMYRQEGAQNFLSVNRVIIGWSRSINPYFRSNPLCRFTKELLNFQLIDIAAVANHEVFGHGSIHRELGGYSEYGISFGGFAWNGFSRGYNVNYSTDQMIHLLVAGSEVNQVLGHEGQKGLFLKDKISADELFMLAPKLDFAVYFYSAENPHEDYNAFINSSYDHGRVAKWLVYKHYPPYSSSSSYTADKIFSTYDQMKLHSYYSFIDPAILVGIYSIFAYTFHDQYEHEIPGLHYNGYKITPGTRVTYNPFGPDAYLDFYVKPIGRENPPGLVCYLRGGEYAGDSSWGTGFEFYNLKKVVDGVRIDYWRQPDGVGLNLEMVNKLKINSNWSLLLDTYYKMQGYLIGKPYDKGLRAFGGIELVL